MANALPQYGPEDFEALELFKTNAESLAQAYAFYAHAIKALKDAHDLYHSDPSRPSSEMSYQVALLNYEVGKAFIREAKDLRFQTGLDEWLL